MRTTPHLVIDISGHGFGHAGMTLPVLNALLGHLPGLKLTIRTAVPASWFADRIKGAFDYVQQSDFGMAMADARHVLPEESVAIYARIHADWPKKIAAATKQLAALKPTLLLSNVTYLSLAAARRLKVPAIAFGPLNWADIFRHYCIHLPGAWDIWRQMVDCYADADNFLQTVPFMPMPSIRDGHAVGPVARMGRDRKRELRRRLNSASNVALVLIALRDMPKQFSFSNWPRLCGIRVLLALEPDFRHPDVIQTAELDFPFIDLVRSCDVLVTKPGYGLITEAACNGTPVLLLPWEDWPETSGLMDWLSQYGRMLMLTDERLCIGDFATEVRKVLAMQAPPAPVPSGVADVLEQIVAYLGH